MCYKRGNPSSTNTSGACAGGTCTIKITVVDACNDGSGSWSYAITGLSPTLVLGGVTYSPSSTSGNVYTFSALPATTSGVFSNASPNARYQAISLSVGTGASGSTTSYTYNLQPIAGTAGTTVTWFSGWTYTPITGGYTKLSGLSAIYGAVSNTLSLKVGSTTYTLTYGYIVPNIPNPPYYAWVVSSSSYQFSDAYNSMGLSYGPYPYPTYGAQTETAAGLPWVITYSGGGWSGTTIKDLTTP